MEGDLFCNTGDSITIRISGIYYQRIVGKGGWATLSESALPAGIAWAKLHPNQLAVYRTALVEAKLIEG